MKSLASDNNAGVHPEIWPVIQAASQGASLSYGHDVWTEQMQATFEKAFGSQSQTFAVLTGTAANVLGLAAVLEPHQAVICSQMAHLNLDEGGAPERFLGAKLITLPTPDGKLCLDDVLAQIPAAEDEHRVQPRVVSITQPTELGTLYTLAEIRALAEALHERGLLLHMDGARIANAVVALDTGFYDMVTATGVDILSFGATKNGLLCGEAVVFLKPELARRFHFVRKQGMQLFSKMRLIAAQLTTYLDSGLWRRNALHANQMAAYLAAGLQPLPELKLYAPVQSNGVFVTLPAALIQALQAHTAFYTWDVLPGMPVNLVRWMTAFDTQKEDLDDFLAQLHAALEQWRNTP
ncbi:MAG: low specificity L-threonine aldolase [Candidatus Sericytochromatia bacterium]|nr:low specificity L-threonine aldolase [Candidatus Sericytochromatia bacterium]